MEACDDPYKILANNIVTSYPDQAIYKILHDIKCVRRCVSRDVNEADLYGDLVDCIMVGLIKSGKYKSVRRTLRQTSEFFFGFLDVDRLREEIRNYCREYGKNIE